MFIVTLDSTSTDLEKQTKHWLRLIKDSCPQPLLTFVVTKMDLIELNKVEKVKTSPHVLETVASAWVTRGKRAASGQCTW